MESTTFDVTESPNVDRGVTMATCDVIAFSLGTAWVSVVTWSDDVAAWRLTVVTCDDVTLCLHGDADGATDNDVVRVAAAADEVLVVC